VESAINLPIGGYIQIVHEVEVPDDYQEYREQDMNTAFEYSPSAWSIELVGYDGKTGQ